MKGVYPLLIAGMLASFAQLATAEVIHEERSLYRTILITEHHTTICLQFSVQKNQRNQSCIDTRRPKVMVFEYTKMMMAALLLNPEPRRVLIVGLGGGTLAMALAELFPEATIDGIEIDPAVVRVAEQFFGFDPGPTITVHEQDARVFTKRALLRNASYDLIMLDAFNGDYIPEHLMTKEYLEETKQLLAPNGVLVANTFSISDLYDHESITYQIVFGRFLNFKSHDSSNRVVIATKGPFPIEAVMAKRANALRDRLEPFEVPLKSYIRKLDWGIDWDLDAKPSRISTRPPTCYRVAKGRLASTRL